MKDKAKLTKEEMVGYLPYKLMVYHIKEDQIMTLDSLHGENLWHLPLHENIDHCDMIVSCSGERNGGFFMVETGRWYYACRFKDIKLILHPLPDLAKPMVYNGEEVIPINYLNKMLPDEMKIDIDLDYEILSDSYGTARYVPFNMIYNVTQKLFAWKFDIRRLIEAGLAINVNILSENPYK